MLIILSVCDSISLKNNFSKNEKITNPEIKRSSFVVFFIILINYVINLTLVC